MPVKFDHKDLEKLNGKEAEELLRQMREGQISAEQLKLIANEVLKHKELALTELDSFFAHIRLENEEQRKRVAEILAVSEVFDSRTLEVLNPLLQALEKEMPIPSLSEQDFKLLAHVETIQAFLADEKLITELQELVQLAQKLNVALAPAAVPAAPVAPAAPRAVAAIMTASPASAPVAAAAAADTTAAVKPAHRAAHSAPVAAKPQHTPAAVTHEAHSSHSPRPSSRIGREELHHLQETFRQRVETFAGRSEVYSFVSACQQIEAAIVGRDHRSHPVALNLRELYREQWNQIGMVLNTCGNIGGRIPALAPQFRGIIAGSDSTRRDHGFENNLIAVGAN